MRRARGLTVLLAVLLAVAGSCSSGSDAGQAEPRSISQSLPPRLLVVDVDADPKQLGGDPGALFEIDPATKAVTLLVTSRELIDPVDVMPERGGSLLLLDLGGERSGALWRVAADAGSLERVAIDAPLVRPTALARAPDGAIWIADRGDGALREPALLRFEPDLRRWKTLARGDPLAVPSAIAFAGDDAFLLDADSFRRDIAELSEGAIFRAPAGGGALELVTELKLVSPLSLAPWRDGFLVTDVNADPNDRRRFTGAVYVVDERRDVRFFAQDPAWRDPSCGTLFGERLLVVDASSDPLGLGDDPVGRGFAAKGRGGVYEVDLATRAISLYCASPDFVNPVRVVVVPRERAP